MQQLSLRQRLDRILVRDIPPRVLDWKVKVGDKVGNVLEKLKKKHERWFIPVLKEDGTLETVIHEEAIWQYAIDKNGKNSYKEDKISAVLDVIASKPEREGLKGISVTVTMDDSVAHTNEIMQNKNVCLAMVVDEKEKPTHYLTTGDVRRVLLQMD